MFQFFLSFAPLQVPMPLYLTCHLFGGRARRIVHLSSKCNKNSFHVYVSSNVKSDRFWCKRCSCMCLDTGRKFLLCAHGSTIDCLPRMKLPVAVCTPLNHIFFIIIGSCIAQFSGTVITHLPYGVLNLYLSFMSPCFRTVLQLVRTHQ